MLVAALGATVLVAGLGTPSSADESATKAPTAANASGATTMSTRAAAARGGSKSTISVLPQISQAGKKASGIDKARTVIAVSIKKGKSGRPVLLQSQSGKSWKKEGKTKLNDRGLASFSVSTTRGGNPISYRATSPKYKGKASVTTATVLSTQWGAADFVDDFSGKSLNPTWSTRVPDYNAKGLRRCSLGSDKAVKVRKGAVQLSVQVDKSRGNKKCVAKRADRTVIGKFRYRVNGHIGSDQSFTYGVAAARMKFQKSKGQHASFWMQPAGGTGRNPKTAGAEIDIIEWFGHPSRGGGLTSFVYYPTSGGSRTAGTFLDNPDQYLSSKSDKWWKQYHVFSVEWTPKQYIFRIDENETWRTNKGVSGTAQFPILSLLSSDYELPQLGNDKKLPQKSYVDWVQFWQAG